MPERRTSRSSTLLSAGWELPNINWGVSSKAQIWRYRLRLRRVIVVFVIESSRLSRLVKRRCSVWSDYILAAYWVTYILISFKAHAWCTCTAHLLTEKPTEWRLRWSLEASGLELESIIIVSSSSRQASTALTRESGNKLLLLISASVVSGAIVIIPDRLFTMTVTPSCGNHYWCCGPVVVVCWCMVVLISRLVT